MKFIAFSFRHEKMIFSASEKSLFQVVKKIFFPEKLFPGRDEKGFFLFLKNSFFISEKSDYFGSRNIPFSGPQ